MINIYYYIIIYVIKNNMTYPKNKTNKKYFNIHKLFINFKFCFLSKLSSYILS